MAKGRGNRHQGKRSSTVVLVLSMLLMLTIVLLLLLGLGILSLPIGFNEDSLPIGDRIKLKRLTIDIKNEEKDWERREQWTEVLSWEPRAFLYHNFLSKEECEYLINLARPHMVKSTVVDSKTGKSKDSRVRTSSGMFLRRGRDKVIRDIEKRIADYTFIPAGYQNPWPISNNSDYHLALDNVISMEKAKKTRDNNYFNEHCRRNYLILIYRTWRRSDVEDGGETIFPAAKGNFSSAPNLSECGKRGLAVVALLLKGISGHLRSGCMLVNTKSSLPLSLPVLRDIVQAWAWKYMQSWESFVGLRTCKNISNGALVVTENISLSPIQDLVCKSGVSRNLAFSPSFSD
ncbi:UNVERIFIED_CONTAM: putative prolyl 4-hydroxylase 3 [Sesamum calycinum]|uniref:Prolyl 4-hydroxylase 3 n=1 Tax=Sesamum calycinum TaxID=2727403 RepID=A0AAW2NXE2_9LAMI